MKKVFLGVLILAAISTTSCSININGVNAMNSSNGVSENYLIRTENLDASLIQKLEANSTSADFIVYGDGDQKSYVEIYAHSQNKKHTKSDIENLLNERNEVSVQQNGKTLSVIGKTKSGVKWSNSDNLIITFKIHIPTKVATEFNTTSGDISLEKLVGSVAIKTTSGDIVASEIKGDIAIKTTSGDMQLSMIKGNRFDLEATSGDVRIENGKAREITIGTASGDVSLSDVDGNTKIGSSSGDVKVGLNSGSLAVSSASGDQQLKVMDPKSEIKISAASGDVTLSVPQSIGAQLDIKGSSVSMSSNSSFDGDYTKGKSIYGKINGGGIPINIRTASGEINLKWN
ncbi:MAG: hypothetical protein DI598_13440 [Pseudopedobacter saltans]|uniref:DUF4097 domain-containing protein n=1 Tax=Pseudopedobacter saltans TaxID=151895 RepID=A0A2W5GTP3_9SPHI|nr:MAG: hypothetical protein DI598_13440 [Pseudopedobacter saltans]